MYLACYLYLTGSSPTVTLSWRSGRGWMEEIAQGERLDSVYTA